LTNASSIGDTTMKMLDSIRDRRSENGHAAGAATADGPREADLSIPGYAQLDSKQVTSQLSHQTQVELETIEEYERSHEDRTVVLNKLRYLRGTEPLPGYDGLAVEEISAALAGADEDTIRLVREYERKFQRRSAVLDDLSGRGQERRSAIAADR
jgi:hypothetical protein